MDLFDAARDAGRSATHLSLSIAVSVLALVMVVGILILAVPEKVVQSGESKQEPVPPVPWAPALTATTLGVMLIVIGGVGIAITAWNSVSTLRNGGVLQMVGLKGVHVHVPQTAIKPLNT